MFMNSNVEAVILTTGSYGISHRGYCLVEWYPCIVGQPVTLQIQKETEKEDRGYHWPAAEKLEQPTM